MKSQDLQTAVESFMAERDIPGTAVAMVADGAITEEFGVGLANVGDGIPATPQTAWPICSLTKSITCTAVMQLAEQGLLGIDDPVQKHLPGWRVADAVASGEITIRQLMRHSSGIGLPGFQERVRTETPNPYPTRESLMAALAGAELQSGPGRFWSYSNEGFATLGHMVERVSGVPLEDYFLTRVFAPAGMRNTLVRFRDWRSLSDRAVNYTRPGSGEMATGETHGEYQVGHLAEDYQTYLSTGGVVSTAHDIALYQVAAMDHDGSPLLGRESLEAMQRVSFEYGDTGWGYGFGWTISAHGGLKTVGHNGGMVGLSTYSLMVPAEGTSVVVLTNRGNVVPLQLAERLLEIVRGRPLWRDSPDQPLPFRSGYRLPVGGLNEFEGEYRQAGNSTLVRAISENGLVIESPAESGESAVMVALPVGPDTFLGYETAQVAHFTRDADGVVAALLRGGFAYERG